jgi:competence/damage-inducible protein CinA-like protein
MSNKNKDHVFEIVATGEELLLGTTLDTNSSHLSQRAATVGMSPARVTIVGDKEKDIADALDAALARTGLVIVTGGLGPTKDDRTRYAASNVFDQPLEFSENSLNRIKELWTRFGRPMPETNELQAHFPKEAVIWSNAMGTADAFVCKNEKGEAAFLPGVPREMKFLTDEFVLPWLSKKSGEQYTTQLIRVFGLSESEIARRLDDWPGPDSPIMLIYGPHFPEIKLTLCMRSGNESDAAKLLADARAELRNRMGDHVFSEDGGDMAQTVAAMLITKGQTLALAESCTGGLIASLLVGVPGSSDFFIEGCVTYSNEAKVRRLQVSESTLLEHGAVSEKCAIEMAEGIRRASGADIGVAVTGIAGPSGGTLEKPVGTVHWALATKEGTMHKKRRLPGNREHVRTLTAYYALDMIRRKMKDEG